MQRVTLLLAALCLSGGLAEAGPPKAGALKKEPYTTKTPRYALLVFGPAGKDRVWLVRDGSTLYVDRNGDGDLTEPGKKVAADRRPGQGSADEGLTFQPGT